MFLDVNGDGESEYVTFDLEESEVAINSRYQSNRYSLIITIDDGLNNQTRINYRALTTFPQYKKVQTVIHWTMVAAQRYLM